MPLRVSPELEYLQVKWAAHLPYAVAATLLKETLPIDQAVSTSGLRNRVWAVGQELDDMAESAIRGERAYPLSDSKVKIVALAVDSAWLRHRPSRQEQDETKLSQYFPSKRPPPTGRHVNIIAGRAVRDDGCCKVYGYVNREVTSAGEQLKLEAALGNTLAGIARNLLCSGSSRFRHFSHFQVAVQHGYPNLNEQVCPLVGPAHLPFFCAPQAHDFIDGRFGDTAADGHAAPIPPSVVVVESEFV